MIRKLAIALVVMTAVVITVGSTLAASGHYVKGPSVSVSGNTVTVSGKAAGLGNIPSTDITLSGSITLESYCVNHGSNKPQGPRFSETLPVSSGGDFAVRNGSVTFSISVTGQSALTCTSANMTVESTLVSYDLWLTWGEFPELNTNFVYP
jgi:hypothetical protein